MVDYQHENQQLRQEIEQLRQKNQAQAEQIQQLKQQEVLLQLVLDNIPQLILWKDVNSVFQGCNRRWAEAAGLGSLENVVGKTDYDLYTDPAVIEAYLSKDRQVIETGKPVYQVEYKAEKNIWYDTKKIPIEVPEGQIVGILATIENITERKQTEQSLILAEEKYRGIFENALEGIFQSNPAGRYLNVNRACAKIYGYESPAEMLAAITDIATQIYVNPGDRQRFERQLLQKDKVTNFEYQVYRKDRQVIWIEEHTRAVRDTTGNVIYYEGIIQDISRRKEEEAQLKRRMEALRIEIDQNKRQTAVKKITQSDYFKELQEEVEALRLSDQGFS